MAWEVRDGRPVELRAPSPLLARLAGTGAPTLLGHERGSDVVAYAPPLPLDRLGAERLAAVFADVADVLARAHALGVSHGPMRDEDIRGGVGEVIVDGWRDDGDPVADVMSLARLIERHGAGHPVLETAAARGRAPVPPTAAGLAATLRARSSAPDRRRMGAIAAVITLAAVVLLSGHGCDGRAGHSTVSGAGGPPAASARTPRSPAADPDG